jgi:hypothetical protein
VQTLFIWNKNGVDPTRLKWEHVPLLEFSLDPTPLEFDDPGWDVEEDWTDFMHRITQRFQEHLVKYHSTVVASARKHGWTEALEIWEKEHFEWLAVYPGTFCRSQGHFRAVQSHAEKGNQNVLFTDSYTFSRTYTNEFRFSYRKLDADQDRLSSQSLALAKTLPGISITNVVSPGLNSSLPFWHANNFLFQDTQTKLSGSHAFRYGVELLRQLVTHAPVAHPLGEIDYNNSPGYSAFANFLDGFSGQPGRIRKTIGSHIFHPDQFLEAYSFQNTWKTTSSLTLTLGLRYDNFG